MATIHFHVVTLKRDFQSIEEFVIGTLNLSCGTYLRWARVLFPIQVQEERQYPLKSIKPRERNVKFDVNRYSVAYNLLKSTSD